LGFQPKNVCYGESSSDLDENEESSSLESVSVDGSKNLFNISNLKELRDKGIIKVEKFKMNTKCNKSKYRHKFSERVDYLKNIKPTECGCSLGPNGGFRTNIMMHPKMN